MNHSPSPDRGCLNRAGAARYLAISVRKLDELASAGELPRIKVGRRTVFRIADLDGLAASKVERKRPAAH